MEDLKLEDGIRVHEETKGQLAIYAQENGRKLVKPFMLVVAQNITEVNRLLEKLTNEAFLGGRYKGRVITVHSNQTGEEKDETVQQLLSVEDPENPTEIVIHVSILKEGWDVTNLYTIVPLRAANSKTLVEQSVGRGLRLPYGRRTGVYAIDRLNIVSHDRFDEIVAEANDPNSIIRAQVVIGRDISSKPQKTEKVESKLEAAIGGAEQQALFATDEERTTARDVLRVIANAPRTLRSADLSRPEVQREIVERLTEPGHASQIRRSIGLNFGSKLMTGFTGWPQDKSIPEAMWQAAVDIFAFDALIQNPDRRDGNPNLFTRGDAVAIYDHDMAFSFLLDLLPSASPWKLGDQRYLTNHVFFRRLRSKPIDLGSFVESLEALSDNQIDRIADDVPTEWNNGSWSRIEAHLRTMRDHAEEFAEEIRRRLV